MKHFFLSGTLLLGVLGAEGDSTVHPDAAFAWGGNVGEFNWRPSLADGVVTGEYVCSGLIWAANAGWINLGDGAPADGIRYRNDDGTDFGVNLLADGSLRGLAWGANIGWINFEAVGDPRINFATGALTGHVWGVGVGWVSFAAAPDHGVATTVIAAGRDSDADGLTDAWELFHTGDLLTLTLNGDADDDGISDTEEYTADSNPLSGEDGLRTTDFSVDIGTGLVTLEWTSRLSRRYYLESTHDVTGGLWEEMTLGEILPESDVTTKRQFVDLFVDQRFYRVRATRPQVSVD